MILLKPSLKCECLASILLHALTVTCFPERRVLDKSPSYYLRTIRVATMLNFELWDMVI